jgi:hypothetical protein
VNGRFHQIMTTFKSYSLMDSMFSSVGLLTMLIAATFIPNRSEQPILGVTAVVCQICAKLASLVEH